MKTKIFTLGLLVILTCFFDLHAAAQCCVAPVNLTVTSIGRHEADLQWQRVRQAGCITPTKFKVQYRVVGTTIWTSVIVKTRRDDKFGDTTLKGLKPSTTYQWRVQGICSSTNKTAFVAGPNFTTLAAAIVNSNSVASSSLQGKLTVTVYPNPVLSNLNITGYLKFGGPIDIQIVNSIGQTVFHQTFNFSSGDFSARIDVSKMQSGVYIVVVNNKTEKVSLNIVKE